MTATPSLPPGIGPGRANGRGWIVLLVLATLVAWGPVLSVLFTVAVADVLDCRVDESRIHPCPGPFGLDLGELLYATGMMGWIAIATAPLMVATLVGWAIVFLRWLAARTRG